MSVVRERGDTLVEVLIAVAILSLVVVGALQVMSAGQAVALNGVERTQVQSILSSQLNLIRYFRDEYIRADNQPTTPAAQDWAAVVGRFAGSTINPSPCSGAVRNGFYIAENYAAAAPVGQFTMTPYTYSAANGVPALGNGVWVEAQQVIAGSSSFVDFVAKACWDPVGSGTKQESKIVMRLAVP